ncbi:MAG: thioredoxin domain-containing protein [Patescibacteria group bacterium]|nr:thioredoxin domain-containing protein [Patescibacteria group bacterium]
MTKQPAFIGAVTLIAVALLIIYGVSALTPNEPRGSVDGAGPEELERVTEPSVDYANPSVGPNDAPLTMIIYSDYICSSCATMQASLVEVLPKFSGDMRLVWKDLPNTSLHPDAKDAAMAARCAAEQGAFWEYHDMLFARPNTAKQGGFMLLAEELGLDSDPFRECLTERRTAALVERDLKEAIALGIDATPYTFIGDRRISGAIGAIQLEATIKTALAAATAE